MKYWEKSALILFTALVMLSTTGFVASAVEICGDNQFGEKDRRATRDSLSIYYRGGNSGVGPEEGRSEVPEEKDFERVIESINLAGSDVFMLNGWNACDFISQVLERIPNNSYRAYRIPIAEIPISERHHTKVNLTIFSKIDLIMQPGNSLDKNSSGIINAECGWMAYVKLQIGSLKVTPVIVAPAQRLNAPSMTDRSCNADEAIIKSFTNKIVSTINDGEQVVIFTDFSSGEQWNSALSFNIQRGFIDFFKDFFRRDEKSAALSELYEITVPKAEGDLRYQTDSVIAPIVAPMFVSQGIEADVTFVNRFVFSLDLPENLDNMWLRGVGAVHFEVRLDTSKWYRSGIFAEVPWAWFSIIALILLAATYLSVRRFNQKAKKAE